MEKALERIKAARKAIWLEEPPDIERLRSRKGTRNQGASAVLYAATKLATLITFLNHMRGVARQGGVDLETMKKVTEPYLEFHAGRYGGFYQLTDTAEVVRWAKEALSEINTLEDYATLVGELAVYLGRVDYWVDLEIPWAQFGQVFEKIMAHLLK
jgi:hypothetical protein